MITWAAILVLIGSIIVSMISIPTQGSIPPDPFQAYIDLLQKNSTLNAVERRDFSCVRIFFIDVKQCSFRPDDSLFSWIIVSFEQDVPTEVFFQLNTDGSLRVGDLAALWGKPDTLFPYSAPG